MKKSLHYFAAFLLFLFALTNCSVKDVVDDLTDTQKALDCAYLLEDIDEKWDDDDRNCDEIQSDVASILDTCNEYLDDEQKAQLQFYADNCSNEN